MAISACLRTPDDIELITREFLAGQAAQNIRYSEVTYIAPPPLVLRWKPHLWPNSRSCVPNIYSA